MAPRSTAEIVRRWMELDRLLYSLGSAVSGVGPVQFAAGWRRTSGDQKYGERQARRDIQALGGLGSAVENRPGAGQIDKRSPPKRPPIKKRRGRKRPRGYGGQAIDLWAYREGELPLFTRNLLPYVWKVLHPSGPLADDDWRYARENVEYLRDEILPRMLKEIERRRPKRRRSR
jgi:hypothetical protein